MSSTNQRRRQSFPFPAGVLAFLTAALLATTARAQSGGPALSNYPAKGGSSEITSNGANYSAFAIANNGFYFLGWAAYPNGPILAANDPYAFVLTDSFIPACAIFAAIAPPTVKITAPVANARLRETQVSITGKTTDIGVVSAVYYALAATTNGPFTWFPATSENGFKTWRAKTLLLPDTNVLAAYAVDNAGALSATNYVKFYNKLAGAIPPSLAGLAAQAYADDGAAQRFSFDDATFAQVSSDTNLASGVGDYTYTVTGPTNAALVLTYTAPSQIAGRTETVPLTFTSPVSAAYSGPTENGTMIFTPVYTLAPSSLADKNAAFGSGDFLALLDGAFSYNPPAGADSIPWTSGVYSWTRFSPEAGLLHQTETDLVNPGAEHDFLLVFSSSSAANLLAADYNSPGLRPFDTVSPVTLASIPTHKTYNAPAAGAGLVFALKPGGQPAYTLVLDDATLASSSAGARVVSGAANYTYVRTGAGIATLSYRYFSPPAVAHTPGELLFLFSSAGGGVYFNTNGFEAGSFSVSHALNLAPASLAGRTVILGPATVAQATLQFQSDTLSWAVGNLATVNGYQLLHPSPRTLIIAVESSGSPPTDSWLQLTFSTAARGTVIYSSSTGVISEGSFSLR